MNSSSLNTSRYLELFLSEARDHMVQMEEILIRLPREEDQAPAIYELFRHAHSLKGMSASMGYGAISHLTHAMEEIFNALRNRELTLTHKINTQLMESIEQINEMLVTIERKKSAPEPAHHQVEALNHTISEKGKKKVESIPKRKISPEAQDQCIYNISIHFSQDTSILPARAALTIKRCSEIGNVLESLPPLKEIQHGRFKNPLRMNLQTSRSEEFIKNILSSMTDIEQFSISLDSKSLSGKEKLEGLEGTVPLSNIRIKAELLDHFLDGVIDMMIQQQKLESILESTPQYEAKFEAEKLGRDTKKLLSDVMAVRMLPFSFISRRFEKSVRELAGRLNKKISLKILGGETELDRSILEEISDPINHLIRNSIDHGIENPFIRKRLHKDETGRISISLERKRDLTIITIKDDGCGIDTDKVKRLALKEGFITKDQHDSLSDQEALMLVTIPGFSTVKNLTTLSGRGIGLDAVRTKIENLGGKIKIQSSLGGGTSIVLTLPPTAAIISAFIVKSRNRLFAIPVSTVQRTARIAPSEIVCNGTSETYWSINGKATRIFDLSSLLTLSEEEISSDSSKPVLLFKLGETNAGLSVDEILFKKNIIVKSLGFPLDQLREYSGASLLENGEIALILDIANIVSI